jgi:protein-L-isoaspartate(D-aspartate) O-methyltransferase
MYKLGKKMEVSEEEIRKLQRMLVLNLKENGIKNVAILNTFYAVRRYDFIKDYIKTESELQSAYFSPFYIGYGQTISQPLICAIMVEALELSKDDKVLEIGTGSGYLTAILAKLAKEVYTVEINTYLLSAAQKRLKQMNLNNIHYFLGNGMIGLQGLKFNRIVVSCAVDFIPSGLKDSLEGLTQIIVLPINDKDSPDGNQRLIKYKKVGWQEKEEFICYCKFVQSQNDIQN